ncbi:MAG TPA: tetratricopeptide repeat protein, partial [Gemmatimonadales bacterium]|nr:tetratricopeptide repeat protein [Gemmatimonadales bacterium]
LLRAVHARPADARAHRELGAYYLDSRGPFEALWELAVARELGGGSPGLTLRMGQALMQGRMPEAAVRLLTDARRNYPQLPTLAVALARTDLAVADPEAALETLLPSHNRNRNHHLDLPPHPTLGGDRLSQSGPLTSPEGLLVLAQAQVALGDLPAARAAARRGAGFVRSRLSGTPEAALAPYFGRLELACGDREAARAGLDQAARDQPGDEETQYYAGLAGAASDREAAMEHFQLAAQADPHSSRSRVAQARLLEAKSGQQERAVDLYREASAIAPSCVGAEEGLARMGAALKQPGEAIYHRARACQLQDRPDEAVRLYRQWGKLQPERWESVSRAAECFMDMSRYLDAAREVRSGLERFPENPELMSALAQLYLHTNNGPDAVRLCERWAPLEPASGRPEWVRGQLAAQALRNDEAIQWFEAAVQKQPTNGVYHATLGETLARTPAPERLRRARAELERATSLEPGMAGFHSQLGQVLEQLGDFEGARQAYLRALDGDSSEAEACRGVMRVARLLGGYPPQAGAGATSFFSRIEREIRDCARDERTAERDLSVHPRDGRARLARARARLRRGDLAKARNDLEIAAEQPEGADARLLLRCVERLLSVL